MRKRICPWEKEVVDALQTKKMTHEIKEHISKCSSCQNIVSVYDWMNQYKRRSWDTKMTEKPLPDPDAIWDRVHARRKPDRTLVKKALRPLIYPQVLSFVVIVIGVFSLLISNAEKIGNITDSRIIARIFPIFIIPMLIILISMAFCALVAAVEKRKKTA
jgi:hypothetical protein